MKAHGAVFFSSFKMSLLSNFLANSSFLTLFLTTSFYWSLLAFCRFTDEQTVKNDRLILIAQGGLLLANFQLLGFLSLRWWDSHHFPLSNLYESFLFLAWSMTLGHFVIGSPFANQSKLALGAITAPSALLVDAFASFSLPENLKLATPLVPALQSNWLMMHVTLMILSYSFLILGSLFSMIVLIFPVGTVENEMTVLVDGFDHLSYRILGLGFPFLTIGILSGAVWANQAWGSYWSWDPKETWALITWLIFAIYFHFRFNKNWRGKKPARIATIGFVFLWICYLGVNLLGKGLHSYGWFT